MLARVRRVRQCLFLETVLQSWTLSPGNISSARGSLLVNRAGQYTCFLRLSNHACPSDSFFLTVVVLWQEGRRGHEHCCREHVRRLRPPLPLITSGDSCLFPGLSRARKPFREFTRTLRPSLRPRASPIDSTVATGRTRSSSMCRGRWRLGGIGQRRGDTSKGVPTFAFPRAISNSRFLFLGDTA